MDRPRRSTRQPVKAPQPVVSPEPRKRKAISPDPDNDKFIKTLLESSKSDLVSLNLNDIINNNTWTLLSSAHKSHLKSLLPPTAFINDSPNEPEPELNPSFFTDPHFLAASRTFQDHLYLGWFSEAHLEKVRQFQAGILDGSLAAPWKDEVWERDNPVPEAPPPPTLPLSQTTTGSFTCPSRALAGGAAEVKLSTLAKNNIIRVGDVIAYRRAFASSLVIEKDAIVESIHPKTYALTVLTVRGPIKDLPHSLLSPSPCSPFTQPDLPNPSSPDSPNPSTSTNLPTSPTSSTSTPILLSTTITSPTTLETALLDTDARMPKARRPNGNAWKCCSVWRWRAATAGGEYYNPYDSRGGRENHGTLFYLRGSFFSDER